MSLTDFKEKEDNSNLPAATCNPNSNTVPVVYLVTDSGKDITSKEEYVTGTIYIDAKGIAGYSDAGSASAPLATELKGRGNWTWNGFDKKPYRIKFAAKTAIMGMKKNKHFALMANADDELGTSLLQCIPDEFASAVSRRFHRISSFGGY